MSGTWRVGNHVGRTLYRDDVLIGVMDTVADAALVAEAVNLYSNEAGTHLHRIERLVNEWGKKIMGAVEDVAAAVVAVQGSTNTLVAIATDLQEAALNIQTEIATLVGEGTPVDTSALNAAVDNLNRAIAPLQAAQASVDALETPPAP